jgi:cytochrome c-type biogenesis protein
VTLGTLIALPIGLGLLGFIEPCSLGSTLLFVKYLESRDRASQLGHGVAFSLARAVFMGILGVVAVAVGSAFVPFQRGAWIGLGSLYVILGILTASGRAGFLAARLGPRPVRLHGRWGAAGLGILFGLNVPACAAPLLLALFGVAAASGASGAAFMQGFVSLGLFGFALSLPLLLALVSTRLRDQLVRLTGLARRLPILTGLILVVLGMWSIIVGVRTPSAAAGPGARVSDVPTLSSLMWPMPPTPATPD